MARAHGRGSTTPTIPIGTVRGRRASAASFALAVLNSLAQAWALVGLGRDLGALLAAGSGGRTRHTVHGPPRAGRPAP